MKTLKYSLLVMLQIASGASLGAWFGFSYADSEFLCGDYKLLDTFRDPTGVVIPKGIIVKARQCKGDIRLEMGLVDENWNFPFIQYQDNENKGGLIYLTSQKAINEDAK